MVSIAPALGSDPRALERNECFAVIGWSALLMVAASDWVASKDFSGEVIRHNVWMTERNQPGGDQEREGWREGVAGTKSLRWEVGPVSLPLVDNILLITHTYSGVRELDGFSYPHPSSPSTRGQWDWREWCPGTHMVGLSLVFVSVTISRQLPDSPSSPE